MSKKVKYNHAVDVAFTVITTNEEPTVDEMIEGMERRLEYLKKDRSEANEAFGVFDTFEVDEED
jgi:hypothetical protein